jgi:hypothetical protein
VQQDFIYEFALRTVDKEVTLTAYRHPQPPDDNASWATAEAIPKVGTQIGELYRSPLDQAPLPGPDSSEG